jgi:hypothetical protein
LGSLRLINCEEVYEKRKLYQTRLYKYNLFKNFKNSFERVAELRCVTASFTSEHTLIFNGRKISYKFPINDDSVTITYFGHQKIKNHRKVDVF